MSRELRRDPLSGEDVIIATERVVERPPSPEHPLGPEQCPFCPGHESHTPPTIQAIERDGRWVARAFANRRPALVVEDPNQPAMVLRHAQLGDGLQIIKGVEVYPDADLGLGIAQRFG